MIDEKDLVILSYLRKNARMSLTQLSKQSKIPVSTLHDRLRVYEGSIKHQYTTLLRFSEVGFFAWAFVFLKFGKSKKEQAKKFLLKHRHVNSMYKVNNGYDILINVVFRDLRELEEFMDEIDQYFVIKAKDVHYIVDDLKREQFLADPAFADTLSTT